MTLLKRYSWETTRITVIAAVVTILVLISGVTEVEPGASPQLASESPNNRQAPVPFHPTPPAITPSVPSPAQAHPKRRLVRAQQAQPAESQPTDPREVTVGDRSISNRYKLVSVERRRQPSGSDELVVTLHVKSLALENLVSPFESDMLEIVGRGLQQPISPNVAFNLRIPSGESRDQEIAFNIPAGLSVDQARLRIHYYNYQNEIPLSQSR